MIKLPSIGAPELIIVFVILLVLFGGKKLPELGKGLGDAMHEFKKAFEDKSEDKKEDKGKKK